MLATGGLAGQVLGGVLVSADLFGSGWRPVFLVNVPIGLALLVAADASGVLITVLQLSQVVGVAAVGSVFLGQVSYPASHAASGHALAVVMFVCAALYLSASVFAHRTRLVLPER